jgi:hypothetical protein
MGVDPGQNREGGPHRPAPEFHPQRQGRPHPQGRIHADLAGLPDPEGEGGRQSQPEETRPGGSPEAGRRRPEEGHGQHPHAHRKETGAELGGARKAHPEPEDEIEKGRMRLQGLPDPRAGQGDAKGLVIPQAGPVQTVDSQPEGQREQEQRGSGPCQPSAPMHRLLLSERAAPGRLPPPARRCAPRRRFRPAVAPPPPNGRASPAPPAPGPGPAPGPPDPPEE